MKTKTFVWEVQITVDEDEVREFLELDEGEERELTDTDFHDCAFDMLENEQCVYELIEVRSR